MRNRIDFERKMSFYEHMLLYYYDRVCNRNFVRYDEWILTESLIVAYNADNRRDSQERLDAALVEFTTEIAGIQRLYNDQPWEVEKPVIWNDRDRDAYYIRNLMDSHRFEVYAESVFLSYGLDIGLFYGRNEQYEMGETRVGIEIKCDKKSVETGNYYFEYQERLNTGLDWTNSGILKNDNTRYYFYGVVGSYSIFPRNVIWDYYRRLVLEGERIRGCSIKEIRRGTSRGFVVPISQIGDQRVYPSAVVRDLLGN